MLRTEDFYWNKNAFVANQCAKNVVACFFNKTQEILPNSLLDVVNTVTHATRAYPVLLVGVSFYSYRKHYYTEDNL